MKYLYSIVMTITLIAIILALAPLACVLLLTLLGVGMYRPEIVIWSNKMRTQGRKMVIRWYGLLSLLALVAVVLGKDSLTIPGLFPSWNTGEGAPLADGLNIHFIDIGQGDAILVDYGDFEMLIDAGDNHYGEDVVDYLTKQKVQTIDYMIATHMDADHIGGMDQVLEHFEVLNIIDSGTKKDTKTYEDYEEARDREGANYQEDSSAIKVAIDEHLWFRVIETGDTYKDENDNSVIIELNYQDRVVLFTGDMEEHAEEQALLAFKDIDVLKSGHHGSRTSSSEAFLKRTRPEYAVISCGKDNKYGHPHPETLEKYAKLNIEVYRTDQLGHIILTIQEDGQMIWQ